MQGLVIKNTGSWYTVLTDDGRTIDSKIKGNFRLKGIRSTNPVAVGDRVSLSLTESSGNETTAFITDIEDRKNYVIRKASNLSKQSHILAANAKFLIADNINLAQFTSIIRKKLNMDEKEALFFLANGKTALSGNDGDAL